MTRKVCIIAASAAFLVLAMGLVMPLAMPGPAVAAALPPRVVYGFDREFPPFSFENPGGKPVGFEVELLEAVLKDKATLVTRPMLWNIIPVELAAGNITVTSGMVRTQERAKTFAFSTLPTFTLQIRMFTKTINRYPNATFLRGQRVSVEEGSYQHRLLETFGGINIRTYKDKTGPIKALYTDEVAAYAGPVQNAYYYMDKLGYGGISTLGTPLGITELRFAINRDRGDILRLVNDGLKTVMENGEYDRIFRKWFVMDLTASEGLQLLNAAKEAALPAYTPYTRKTRGAAILTATGQVYKGTAVENADPALSVSALTAALTAAISASDMELRATIVVDADGTPVTLSATELRQLNEFGRGILTLTFDEEKNLSSKMVGELLPGTAAPAKR